MPAFTKDQYNALYAELEALRNRMLDQYPLELTYQDVLDLTAPKEHHAILKKAAKIAHIQAYSTTYIQIITDVGRVFVGISLNELDGKAPPLHPKQPQVFRGPVYDRLMAWIDNQLEVRRKFGLAAYTLEKLNAQYTKAQVRYLWPAILYLCKGEALQELHDSIADFKPLSRVPTLSYTLRRACQESAAILTLAHMTEPKPERRLPVEIRLADMPSFRFEDKIINRL